MAPTAMVNLLLWRHFRAYSCSYHPRYGDEYGGRTYCSRTNTPLYALKLTVPELNTQHVSHIGGGSKVICESKTQRRLVVLTGRGDHQKYGCQQPGDPHSEPLDARSRPLPEHIAKKPAR